MRDLYATTMQLVHLGGGDAFEVACERALDWTWRVEEPKPDLTQRPIGVAPEEAAAGDTTVSWWSAASEPARALELRMRHPDTEDATLEWQATITVSDIEGNARVTVRLERGASVHVLRPGRLALRAPTVVLDFMRAPLRAYAGTLELSAGSRLLEARDVRAFVEDVLRAEGRALPVLVAACDVEAGLVESLVKGLAGLVQVVRIANTEAAQALRASLESRFEVPRRGLRLYWPDFGLPGQPHRHPYWTAAQVRAGARGGRSVINQLIKLLAPISTGRVPADPGVLRARREVLRAAAREQQKREQAKRERSRRDRQRAQATAAKVAQDSTAGEEVDRLKERLAEVEDQVGVTESERDAALEQTLQAEARELRVIEESLEVDARAGQLGSRVAQLEAENINLRENLKAFTRYEAEEADEQETEEGVPEEVDSWEGVAEHLPALDGPGFRLTEQALKCADGKPRYSYPDVMWQALRALERVGRAYNELGADLGMRFDKFAIEKAGLDVALQDGTYADDCWFEYEGDQYQRLPHVKIDDAKSPNAVGRIYFALDSAGKRLIIDWFGTKPDRPKSRRPH